MAYVGPQQRMKVPRYYRRLPFRFFPTHDNNKVTSCEKYAMLLHLHPYTSSIDRKLWKLLSFPEVQHLLHKLSGTTPGVKQNVMNYVQCFIGGNSTYINYNPQLKFPVWTCTHHRLNHNFTMNIPTLVHNIKLPIVRALSCVNYLKWQLVGLTLINAKCKWWYMYSEISPYGHNTQQYTL